MKVANMNPLKQLVTIGAALLFACQVSCQTGQAYQEELPISPTMAIDRDLHSDSVYVRRFAIEYLHTYAGLPWSDYEPSRAVGERAAKWLAENRFAENSGMSYA